MIVPHDYPELFRPRFWFGTTDVQFKLLKAPPQSHLIANVNIVPRCGDGWLMIFAEDWQTWEMPGGTLEPDEHYLQAIERELMEEAGAKITAHKPLGAWRCHNQADAPYRPHLPHPIFYRYVVVGDVTIVGEPLNPQDGETISKVEVVPLQTAVDRFNQQGRGDVAALYQIAAQMTT